jgi:hypothetical protein
MIHTKGTSMGPIVKSLLLTMLKLIAIALAFACKIIGLIITKIGEIFEKLSGHGNH